MARTRTSFICQNCGAVAPRWQGRCDACGAWNSIIEETARRGNAAGASQRQGPHLHALRSWHRDRARPPRITTGHRRIRPRHRRRLRARFGPAFRRRARHRQIDLADPGLRRARREHGHRIVYISGEEAIDQVRLRAERLGSHSAPIEFAAETKVEDIVATLRAGPTPTLLVIDSIQTMWTDIVESVPGTVTQVRGAAQALDPLRQDDRCDGHSRRPCHQGRPDRRAARRRTYGRCGDLVRRRRRPRFPHPARA